MLDKPTRMNVKIRNREKKPVGRKIPRSVGDNGAKDRISTRKPCLCGFSEIKRVGDLKILSCKIKFGVKKADKFGSQKLVFLLRSHLVQSDSWFRDTFYYGEIYI